MQEYAAATAEAEMAEAKSVRQGEEAEAFRRIADEKRHLAYQLADKWTGSPPYSLSHTIGAGTAAMIVFPCWTIALLIGRCTTAF